MPEPFAKYPHCVAKFNSHKILECVYFSMHVKIHFRSLSFIGFTIFARKRKGRKRKPLRVDVLKRLNFRRSCTEGGCTTRWTLTRRPGCLIQPHHPISTSCREYLLPSWKVRTIGGSMGAPGTPPGSKFFHYLAVFGKKIEKILLLWELPPRKILDRPLRKY